MMKKKMELCVPCAEELKKTNTLKLIPGRSEKITCDHCHRRRYGSAYEVEKKKAKA